MNNASTLPPNSSLNESVYADFYGKVYGYLFAKLGSRVQAEDLAADVFVKIYAKIDTFDSSKAALSTWIYTVARNTLTDYFRSRRVWNEIPPDVADGVSLEDEVCNRETLAKLAAALETLEERERAVIVGRYYQGITLKEIAAQLDISYAYVKVLQKKALEKLQKLL